MKTWKVSSLHRPLTFRRFRQATPIVHVEQFFYEWKKAVIDQISIFSPYFSMGHCQTSKKKFFFMIFRWDQHITFMRLANNDESVPVPVPSSSANSTIIIKKLPRLFKFAARWSLSKIHTESVVHGQDSETRVFAFQFWLSSILFVIHSDFFHRFFFCAKTLWWSYEKSRFVILPRVNSHLFAPTMPLEC